MLLYYLLYEDYYFILFKVYAIKVYAENDLFHSLTKKKVCENMPLKTKLLTIFDLIKKLVI